MSREIRIGLIGLGNRGISLLEQVILPQKVCVAAVCDMYEDRREDARTPDRKHRCLRMITGRSWRCPRLTR